MPGGDEAVDAAVDEAMLDWRPDLQDGERTLAVLGRVSGLTGMLVGAVAVGRAFRSASAAGGSLRDAIGVGFGNALVAIAVGSSAMILAILSKALLRRSALRTRTDLEKAANLLAKQASKESGAPAGA